VLAATNRPQDLDEAALRRLTRRIYMPLPDEIARRALIEGKLNSSCKYSFSEEEWAHLMKITEGYSCADLQFIVKEVAMTPIREMPTEALMSMKDSQELRALTMADFDKVLNENNPSVSDHTIQEFDEWRKRHGK